MQNGDLAHDYVHRASVRARALAVLYDGESWADVVRESQEPDHSTSKPAILPETATRPTSVAVDTTRSLASRNAQILLGMSRQRIGY
jgi:hypothetical protein